MKTHYSTLFTKTLVLGLFYGLSSMILASCNTQEEEPQRPEENSLEYVLELLAMRQLSQDELDRAVEEFRGLFESEDAHQASIKANVELVAPLANRPGEPMDLYTRHWYSSTLYFSPTQAGTFIQQLSNEADPIQVIDPKSQRVLKYSDIIALLNLNSFIREGGNPVERDFSDEEVQNLVAFYQQEFEQGFRNLPHRLTMGAELWAGLSQNGNKLSVSEQQEIVAYLTPGEINSPLTPALYQKWLALTPGEAENWHSWDEGEYLNARLDAVIEREFLLLLAQVPVYVYYLPW